MRRLLAYQLKLTQKRGLPLSRLLSLVESETRYSRRNEQRRMQEESASPMLSRKTVTKAEVEEKEGKVDLVDMKKEEERCFNMGALTGDSLNFTQRSSQPEVTLPNLNTCPQLQLVSPFPSYVWVPVPAPAFTSFYQSSLSDLMPGYQWMICGTCHSWGTVMMI